MLKLYDYVLFKKYGGILFTLLNYYYLKPANVEIYYNSKRMVICFNYLSTNGSSTAQQ